VRTRKTDRHLPPCVYLKHGRYWYVKAKKWNDLGTDLAEALAEYARRVEEPAGTMPEFLERALAHHRAIRKPPLSQATLDQYRLALNTRSDVRGRKGLKQVFAEFAPGQIKTLHVMAMRDAGVATPNMTNRKLSLLRTLFDYAVAWGEAERNPCLGVKRLREHERTRYITDDEFAAIYAKAGPRLQVIMDLQYLTGQRVNDVLRLKRKQITEDGILLSPQKTRNSTGVEMLLMWSPELRAVVERAKALHGNVHALTLLHGRTGKAPNYRTVSLQFEKAAKAAGVPDARLNDQRAKSATDTAKQGKNPRALLGHSSEAMTARYLRSKDTPLVEGPATLPARKKR
jgi:integrase